MAASDFDYAVVIDRQRNLRGRVSQRLMDGTGTVAWLPVLDGDRYLGVPTPEVVHSALRQLLPQRQPAA